MRTHYYPFVIETTMMKKYASSRRVSCCVLQSMAICLVVWQALSCGRGIHAFDASSTGSCFPVQLKYRRNRNISDQLRDVQPVAVRLVFPHTGVAGFFLRKALRQVQQVYWTCTFH